MVKDIPTVLFYKTYKEAADDFELFRIKHGPYVECQITRGHIPLEAWVGDHHLILITKADYMWWCLGKTYKLADGDTYRSGYRLREEN